MKILIHIIKHFFNFSAILPNWIGKQTEKKSTKVEDLIIILAE